MVRFPVFLGVSGIVSLAFVCPAWAAEAQEDGARSRVNAAAVFDAYQPRRLVTPESRITRCEVCSGHTCAIVKVRGRCTVDKAVRSLRLQKGRPMSGGAVSRHRDRAVTAEDYQPLAIEGVSEPGRAQVSPQHSPQADRDPGTQILDIYENSNRSLSVREKDSQSVKAVKFRPLDLNADSTDGESDADEMDEDDNQAQ